MSKSLFVAWRAGGSTNGQWGPVGRLDRVKAGYRFVYTHGAQTLRGFTPFVGMPNLDQVYESQELFPLFANRLLARSRPEYERFLRWSGFDPNHPPDPIAILGVTEGRRATDSVEVFPQPQPDSNGCYINKFFLHGVRWMTDEAKTRIASLQSNEQLFLEPEPANEYDPNAVAVHTSEGTKIGYVPRYLAQDARKLTQECDKGVLALAVERVNPDAPMQQRVLCRMEACWPDAFAPCTQEEFKPITCTERSSLAS